MKRFTFISMLALLIPLNGIGQNQNALLDDIYFKPSDAYKAQKTTVNKQKPNYKNGAKEIIYLERNTPKTSSLDTTFLLAQTNDSINYAQKNIKQNETEYEYAQRIRQFHNSKDTVLIIDTVYVSQDNNDSYSDINNNPYWWNNNHYGNWGWGNNWYSPYYGYGGWNNYPWGYNNFYGYGGFGGYYGAYGFGGYGGYYGYGYPYYGYMDYYGYGYGYPYYGYDGYYGGGNWSSYYGKTRNPNHDEANRRSADNNNPTGNRYGQTSNGSQSITGGSRMNSTSQNPYTVVSGNGMRGTNQNEVINGVASRPSVSTTQSTARSFQGTGNGIGLVRNGGTRNTSGLYQNYSNSGSTVTTRTNNGTTIINTRPRTATVTTYSTPSTSNGISRSSYSSGSTNTVSSSRPGITYSSGSRSTTSTSSTNYSSGSRSSSSSSSSYTSPSYSSPSYSSGSSSGSSYSGSSSGGSSRSSGGGGSSAGSRR